jgi:hypothetical protein
VNCLAALSAKSEFAFITVTRWLAMTERQACARLCQEDRIDITARPQLRLPHTLHTVHTAADQILPGSLKTHVSLFFIAEQFAWHLRPELAD